MSSSQSLASALQRLASHDPNLPAELRSLLSQVLALLESGKTKGWPFNELKKAGAWKDKPLPANDSSKPCYVRIPIEIEIVNVDQQTLRAELSSEKVVPVPEGTNNSKITIPGPPQ